MQHFKKGNNLIILILVLTMFFVFSCGSAAFATELSTEETAGTDLQTGTEEGSEAPQTETPEEMAPSYTFAEPGSIGIVTTTALNLRGGPATDKVALAYIRLNDEVTILDNVINDAGEHWYYVQTESGSKGYASAKFILVEIEVEYVFNMDFEAHLTAQGFPESYKPYLRDVHARYPNWVFNAAQTGLDWNAVIDAESGPGTTLVASSSPSSWKSMEEGAYDYEKNKYITYDSGGWVTASEQIIKHYMDSRNFINPVGIFQFLTHSFDENTQTEEGLQKVIQSSFMKGEFPEDTHETWAQAIYQAGRIAGVNPYVLASMIIVEQGSSGNGGCISGTVSGYEGYYNFFNIGAYKSGSMSAVQRGVWYASQSGSYERPWNTRYKSILGGALFYSQQYVQKNKNTLYFKKFNVMNGQENVGIGQYMTNVQGAESEAAALRNGYIDTLSDAMTFYIPVYQNMPEEACALPGEGNNNTYLSSLKVDGYELTPEFSRGKTDYELVVGKDVASVNITAEASSSSAVATGGGLIVLASDITKAEIIVTSASGQTRTYTITISKMAGGPAEEETAITSSEYIFDTYLKGVDERTEFDEFAANIQVTGGQAVIRNAKGEAVTEGSIATGMSVILQDNSGADVIEYKVVIRGDVSGDGKINSADALGIQRHIVESRLMEGAYLEAADINQDGRVNSLDVLYVQKHIVGSYTIEN